MQSGLRETFVLHNFYPGNTFIIFRFQHAGPSALLTNHTLYSQGKPCAITFRSVGTQDSLPLPSPPNLLSTFDIRYSAFDIRHSFSSSHRHSIFGVRHSTFDIRHSFSSSLRNSKFGVRHSTFDIPSPPPFDIRHSAFDIRHSTFLLLLPSIFGVRYSAFGVRHSTFLSFPPGHRASPALPHYVPLELGYDMTK